MGIGICPGKDWVEEMPKVSEEKLRELINKSRQLGEQHKKYTETFISTIFSK